MRKYFFLVLCFFALHLGVSLGNLNVQEAGFKVVLPTKRSMTMAIADFGKPKYGGTLTGTIVYPSEEKGYLDNRIECSPQDCQYGCVPFNESTPPFSIKKDPGSFVIMLLDRGPHGSKKSKHPCLFLEKAFHAQLAGADAVLVVNDEPGDISTAVAPDSEEAEEILSQLTISAAMVSMEDGKWIKQLLLKGPVVAQLSWNHVFPKSADADPVRWELWYNPNSDCPDPSCERQKAFLESMQVVAQTWELQNLTHFSPHYLIWTCPAAFVNTTECVTQCIMAGRYCVPDPDESLLEGYSGRDVLLMNMRHLCFHRLASSSGMATRWWDYINKFNRQCTMDDDSFNEECATQVFHDVHGEVFGPGSGNGLAWWRSCWEIKEEDDVAAFYAGDLNATLIPLLEDELAAQEGSPSVATVNTVPAVRINGQLFRGTLDAAEVTRALCAALPDSASIPAVCNNPLVSEDECAEGGIGYNACHSAANEALNKNRCVNTFAGYTCDCRDGWAYVRDPITGEESCQDINECLVTNIAAINPRCGCDRCTCINLFGGYNCSGPLPDRCTAADAYGGCWSDTLGGKLYHACVDDLPSYRRAAERGTLAPDQNWTRCVCPPCFQPAFYGGCEPVCDLETCNHVTGQCNAVNGGSGSGSGSKSGVSKVGFFVGIFLAAGLAALAVFVMQHSARKRYAAQAANEILAQYMPLGGHGGGGAAGELGSTSNGGGGGGGNDGMRGSAPSLDGRVAAAQGFGFLRPFTGTSASAATANGGGGGTIRIGFPSGNNNTNTTSSSASTDDAVGYAYDGVGGGSKVKELLSGFGGRIRGFFRGANAAGERAAGGSIPMMQSLPGGSRLFRALPVEEDALLGHAASSFSPSAFASSSNNTKSGGKSVDAPPPPYHALHLPTSSSVARGGGVGGGGRAGGGGVLYDSEFVVKAATGSAVDPAPGSGSGFGIGVKSGGVAMGPTISARAESPTADLVASPAATAAATSVGSSGSGNGSGNGSAGGAADPLNIAGDGNDLNPSDALGSSSAH